MSPNRCSSRSMLAASAFLSMASAMCLTTERAFAGCHLVDCVEDVYITRKQVKKASCETLWILRNSIFDDAGYCFKTERAQQFFSNTGCTIDDQAAVPLNDYQRANIKVLEAAEAEKGC